MKILVFSDSHGKYNNMQKAIDLHPDAQYILFLGDGIADLDTLESEGKTVYKVNGNFEDCFTFTKKAPSFKVIEIEGKRIFMCHGHTLGVSGGLQRLCYAAIENNADIALYGHTHVKHEEYIPQSKLPGDRNGGLYIFNPGSISRPRDDVYPSYGMIDVSDKGILLSHGLIKN